MSRTVTDTTDADRADIKAVPRADKTRQRIRSEAVRCAAVLDSRRPPGRTRIESAAHDLLGRLHLSSTYLGFAMVAISNEVWRSRFAAVPTPRRLLLLPHCLRNVEACAGVYSTNGLSCAQCGACDLGALRAEAEALGYTVIIAEGTPGVVGLLVRGQADAILGMACLDSLEKAFSRVSALGVPHVAVPLLTNGCVNTTGELHVLRDWLRLQTPQPGPRTHGYLSILRAAEGLFEADALEDLLAGLVRAAPASARGLVPAHETEALAIEWLREGGKRFRPFVTLASYAAFSCREPFPAADGEGLPPFPRAIRQVALAVEVFHKASLIHDDIEDDDSHRYGREALHRRYGLGVALNVGDYLIGLGYRLAGAARAELGAEAAADIAEFLSDAHVNLCCGQGEELLWSQGNLLEVRPEDAQRIYALKTAPAFEAAIRIGARAALGHNLDPVRSEALKRYCRFVGAAYQLLNDFKDWDSDRHGKVVAGQDSLAWRPTMLLALALEAGGSEAFSRLASLPRGSEDRKRRLEDLRTLYEEQGAFEKGRALVSGYRQRARSEADAMQPEALRELMHFIVEAVL